MTPPCTVNYLVTLVWRSIPRVHCPAACSQVRSTHDAEAIATREVAVASTPPRWLVEPREQANRLAESSFPVFPNKRNSHVSLSCMPNDAQQVADDAQLRDDTNRRQFHVALLEDCSFFAHLVLRHVRAGGNRNSPRKKWNVAKVSQALPQPSSDILPWQLPMEERALEPEVPSSSLPTLWVEMGCRHAQTLVSKKERHEYRENAKPAL
jgi:hypothetical protein